MLQYLLASFDGPAGFFMYVLLALLAYELAVAAERAWFLLYAWRVDADAVIHAAEEAVRTGTRPKLGTTPLERVLGAGLEWTDAELAWDAMAAASVDAEQRIRRRVPYLATVASVATMVGLFGTVYGLILAFGTLGDASAAERAAKLSEGSSTAMSATLMGLFVAIPALGLHAVAESLARSRLAEIERGAARLALALKARTRA